MAAFFRQTVPLLRCNWKNCSQNMDLHWMLVPSTYQDSITQKLGNTFHQLWLYYLSLAVSRSSVSAAKGTRVSAVSLAGARMGGSGPWGRRESFLQYGAKEVGSWSEGTWTFGLNWSSQQTSDTQLPVEGWATTLTLGSNIQGRSLGIRCYYFPNIQ